MPTQYDPAIDAGARETAAVARRDLSRRDALRLGAAGVGGGAVALLAGCGGGNPGMVPTIGPDEVKADSAAVGALLELERTAVIAYEVAQGKLRGAARAVAQRLRGHEQAHGSAIESYVASLLEEAVHLPAVTNRPPFDKERAQAAGARIRELRKGVTLGGLTIRELIDEGRP